jgi:chromosome segregation ATPase
MFRFVGRTLRWAAVGTLVAVGLVAVVGLGHVKAAYWTVREHLRDNMDEIVDSKIALRHELRKLERDYPKRIAELTSYVHRIDQDLLACDGDRRLSREVVTLCEADVSVLRERIASLESRPDGDYVTVEFRAEVLDRDAAIAKASRIVEKASSHRARLVDLDDEAQMLRSERARLVAELETLESEYRSFQSEAASLLREVESIKRKEKLVALLERRRQEHDDLFRDRAGSLALVKQKLTKKRVELDARIEAARTYSGEDEYEARARLSLAKSRHRTD